MNTSEFLSLFAFHDSVSVPKQFFVIAVTLATILPRMPFDAPWTIGGNLSHSFRRLLLVIAFGYLIRHWADDVLPESISLLMTAMEGVALSFLSLLTPYLLRKWLSTKVNIPGGRRNPGYALMPWVYLFAGLSAFGLLVRVVTQDSRTWIIKRVADVLSFMPVMNTLRMYNSVTNAGTMYPGRGSILSQIVVVGEYYAVFGHSADIAIRIFGLLGLLPDGFTQTTLAQGLYANILFAGYLRVLCHSILLNILDEAYIIGSVSSEPDSPSSGTSSSRRSSGSQRGPTVETVGDDAELSVLVVK